MSGWKTVPWDGVSISDEANELEFRDQGELVSMCREPPQNTTDNPKIDFSSTGSVPVKLRYTLKIVKDSEALKNIFPEKGFINHITVKESENIVNFLDEYDCESFIQLIEDEGMVVLLVEDYETTGLVGDVQTPKNPQDVKNDNTFYGFFRARGKSLMKAGRGGSWGLGKYAFPIASSIRTFFCVTSRDDPNERFLAGQAFLNERTIFEHGYDQMMYYCKDELQVESQPHSWLPIDDVNQIDSFCELFGLDRKVGTTGTSFVIPLPKKDLTMKKLVLGLITNWIIPILEGKLELEFVEERKNIHFNINKKNVREFVQKKLPEDVWKASKKTVGGTNTINPAWISKPRIEELITLHDQLIIDNPVLLGTPNADSAPTTQYDVVFPEKDGQETKAMINSYNAGELIHVRGSLPIKLKGGKSKLGDPIKYGEYDLVFRKCENEDAAEAHFYRDQISIPGVHNRKALIPGVSSLLIVSGGSDNPLAEMLRQSEGPAHLTWKPGAPRLKDNYLHGPRIITFLRNLVQKLVHHISSSQVESQSLWTDIFSLGSDKPKPPPAIKHFNIRESAVGGSCTIEPSAEIENMVGHTYIARIGYPVPATLKRKKGTDPRNINVHEMTWTATGAQITQDVLAENGEVCVDRVRVHITDEAFNIQVDGLAINKRAQIVLNQELVN